MIETASRKDAPFFLYAAYTALHWPLHARAADIELFHGRYGCGWDAIRCLRHETLKGMGIPNPRWDISPRAPQSHPWHDDPHKEWQDLRMAVYAAQVHCMDRDVGLILDALRRLGKDRDTRVFFLSDNGGCAEFVAEDPNKPETSRCNIPTRNGRPMRIGNTPASPPTPTTPSPATTCPWPTPATPTSVASSATFTRAETPRP